MEKIKFIPIYLKKNKGLGNALKVAVEHCSHKLIARMDSDDISAKNRFQLQLECFMNNINLDIVGGNITEFVGDEKNITGQRAVPLLDKDIKEYMKKRCPMNHVAVMYKKDAVQKAGGYIDWPWNEDYYLWIRMMENCCTFENIPQNLVNVRTGAAMSARRGGMRYFESEKNIQKYMLDKRIISWPRYLYNVMIRFAGEVVANNTVRTFLFRFMREKYRPEKDNIIEERSIFERKSYPKFSVAMSVYGKDNAEWFDRALESIIISQTVKPNEIVLVVDGAIPDDIQKVIDKYSSLVELYNE